MKSEEVLLKGIGTYFSKLFPISLEKFLVKFGLTSVISSADFQTSSPLLIFFVFDIRSINEFEKVRQYPEEVRSRSQHALQLTIIQNHN